MPPSDDDQVATRVLRLMRRMKRESPWLATGAFARERLIREERALRALPRVEQTEPSTGDEELPDQ